MYKITFFVILVLTLVDAGSVKNIEDVIIPDSQLVSEAKLKVEYSNALDANAKYKPFKEAVSLLSNAYDDLYSDYEYYLREMGDPFYYMEDVMTEFIKKLEQFEKVDDLVFKIFPLSYEYYLRHYFNENVANRRVIPLSEAFKAGEKMLDEFAEMKDSVKNFVLNSVTPFIKSINTNFTYAKDLLNVEDYEYGFPDEKLLNTFYSNIDKIIDLAKRAFRVFLKFDERVQALVNNESLSESEKIKQFIKLFKDDQNDLNKELKSYNNKIEEIDLLYPCYDFVGNAKGLVYRLLPDKKQLKKPTSLLDKLPDYIKNAKNVSTKEEVPKPQKPTILKQKFADKVKSIKNNLSNALKKLQLKKSKKSKK